MYRVSPENPGKLGVVDANGDLMATFEPEFTVTEDVEGVKTTAVVVNYIIENGASVSTNDDTNSAPDTLEGE